MFTGIIQVVGSIGGVSRRAAGIRVSIRAPFSEGPLAVGESIAVDGVCLTVARVLAGRFEADVGAETISRTGAARWARGRRVNLERALLATDRLGGHLVQGHVDGTGRVLRLGTRAGQVRLRVQAPASLRPLIAEKGSIAVDGVSLTVSARGGTWFEAALVPHTLGATTLGDRKPGDLVNLEADLVARYVARLLGEARRGT